MLVAYLCNLLFVINHQQGYRQKDDSEALNGVLKSPGCGQLVALLQAGDEIRETQAHSRQPLLCPTVLRRKSKIKKVIFYFVESIRNYEEKEQIYQ